MPRVTEPIWIPPAGRVAASNLTRFAAFARDHHGAPQGDYESLWRWSVDERETFWTALAEFAGVIRKPGRAPVLQHRDRMPGAVWFEDTELNFAENLLARADDHAALVFCNERGARRELSYRAAARRGGPDRGRTARTRHRARRPRGRLPAEPARGRRRDARRDEPRRRVDLLLARLRHQRRARPVRPGRAARAVHGGRLLLQRQDHRLAGARARRAGAAAVRRTRRRHTVRRGCTRSRRDCAAPWPSASSAARAPRSSSLACRSTRRCTSCIPRARPACRSASCTAWAARCCSIARSTCCTPTSTPDDRLFFFTTCGWMMWNWLVSGLATGCTVVLYEGSPFAPDRDVLWRMAERERDHGVRHQPEVPVGPREGRRRTAAAISISARCAPCCPPGRRSRRSSSTTSTARSRATCTWPRSRAAPTSSPASASATRGCPSIAARSSHPGSA